MLDERIAGMEQLRQEAALKDALLRLKVNSDFRILMTAYTETLALKLIKQKAVLVKQGLNTDNLDKQLDAIGLFTVFLDDVIQIGDIATNSINHDMELEN